VLGGVRALVGVAVFKTDEVEYLGLAGSIPVLLRRVYARSYGRCGWLSAVARAVANRPDG
jgi:hypothetical protein